MTPRPLAIDAPPEGLALRRRGRADLPFLRALYASTRALEMAVVPWPDAAKAAFLEGQFDLQDAHVARVHAGADLLIVEAAAPLAGDRAIGRLSLDREGRRWRLIDIALMPGARGRGHGTALLRWLQAHAAAAGAGIELHVLDGNARAEALYRRLGFAPAASDVPTHRRMLWPAPAVS